MFSSTTRIKAMVGTVVSVALALTLAAAIASGAAPIHEGLGANDVDGATSLLRGVPTLAGWRSP